MGALGRAAVSRACARAAQARVTYTLWTAVGRSFQSSLSPADLVSCAKMQGAHPRRGTSGGRHPIHAFTDIMLICASRPAATPPPSPRKPNPILLLLLMVIIIIIYRSSLMLSNARSVQIYKLGTAPVVWHSSRAQIMRVHLPPSLSLCALASAITK